MAETELTVEHLLAWSKSLGPTTEVVQHADSWRVNYGSSIIKERRKGLENTTVIRGRKMRMRVKAYELMRLC